MAQQSRRTFMKQSAAAVAALSAVARGQTTNAASKFILSAPLTHSDWILKPNIAAGVEGVRHMLDACKAWGFSRIYWRALDGGRAMYKSKLLTPADNYDADSFWSPQSEADRKMVEKFTSNLTPEKRKELVAKLMAIDYTSFDTLAAAVEYGHSIGLQIHAWVSINEDDHGWGLVSKFSREHPQFRWVKRDGTPYHSQLSFAYPEVREYKLGILKELLEGYEVDGLFLDWIRTGDIRDNPQTDKEGVANSGYETPNFAAFKERFHTDDNVPNNDERWIRTRAEPQTVFMREARKLTQKPIAVLVGHPWHYRGMQDPIAGNLKGLLLDVPTWSKEKLFDSAVAAGYYRANANAEMAYNALRKEVGEGVDVWVYAWVPSSVGDVVRDTSISARVGAKQILFWEADYIDDRGNAAELRAAMRERAV